MGSSKRSLQSYKDQASEIHRGKYNYDNWTNLGKYHDKIAIVCSEHGMFTQSLANHISRKSGCPACRAAMLSSGVRSIPINQWVDRANYTHDNKYQYIIPGWFSNADTDQITIICPAHGEFSQTLADHVRKAAGCPQCAVASRKLTCVERYGVSSAKMQHISHESLALLQDPVWLRTQHVDLQRSYAEIASQLGVQDGTVGRYAKSHQIDNIRYPRSEGEKQVLAVVSEMTTAISSNRSIIHPLELDIVLPTVGVAIEYCGLYWHGDLIKSPEYHASKYNQCNQKSIRLITLFEDEWKNNHSAVISTLRTIIDQRSCHGIDANTCEAIAITKDQADQFFRDYHIYGSAEGDLAYGLLFDHQLVAAISINVVDQKLIINRYASNRSIGCGLTKLLSAITDHWTLVEAIVDLRWDDGRHYVEANFTQAELIQPDYYWTDGKSRWNNNQGGIDHSKLWKIYDCGKIKYSLTQLTR